MAKTDFDRIARELLSVSDRVVQEMFPRGVRRGREFLVGNLYGDPGDSLSINLETGVWCDFASGEGEKGGNLITLYAKKQGIKNGEAAKALCERHGIAYESGIVKYSKPAPTGKPDLPPEDAPRPDMANDGMWCYKDGSGRPLFWVTRHDDDKGKRYCPWTWSETAQRWIAKAWPSPRPLYGIETVVPGRRVLVVEGEKCADAARQLFGERCSVVTWSNGARAYNQTDWTPLTGMDVTIWPDADEPGMLAGKAISKILHRMACRVKLLDVSSIQEPGWDIGTAIENDWDTDKIVAFAADHAITYSEAEAGITIKIENPEDGTVCADAGFDGLWDQLGLMVNGSGKPINNAINVFKILKAAGSSLPEIHYDEFACEVRVMDSGRLRGFNDADMRKLLIMFQSMIGFTNVSTTTMWDGIQAYAESRSRHPIREWVNALKWDNKPRLNTWLVNAAGAEDVIYNHSVGKNFFLSMMSRVFEPGSKVDTMIILEGAQGAGKTTMLEIIGGEYFGEIGQKTFDPREFVMAMQGHLIVEMGELHAFKTADIEALKSFITTRVDLLRSPYERKSRRVPRQCIFVGTTNLDEYLVDHTGGRRFWPVKCHKINNDWLRENRDQLFAEAYVRYSRGEKWHEVPETETAIEQEKRRHTDPWEDIIREQIGRLMPETTTKYVLTDVLQIAHDRQDQKHRLRLCRVLKSLGFVAVTSRRGTETVRVWRSAKAGWSNPQEQLPDVEF